MDAACVAAVDIAVAMDRLGESESWNNSEDSISSTKSGDDDNDAVDGLRSAAIAGSDGGSGGGGEASATVH